MPSNRSPAGESLTRRRLVGALGTVATGSLAGCAGRVPGGDPARIDADATVADGRALWRYPPREDDQDGIGYAAVDAERRDGTGSRGPVLRLEFNSTVGGIASAEPYRGFRADSFRFRVRPPSSYEKRLGYRVQVEPPGQWEGFGAYYDIEGGVREFVVELRDVDADGTILVPAVFDPGSGPLPDALHCSFTVRASRPGVFGKTVRVSDRATLELGGE